MTVLLLAVVLAQTDIPPATLFDYVSDGGALALLIWIVIGASREWWFTRGSYLRLEAAMKLAVEKAEKERDEWKVIALRSLNTTDRAVTQLEPPA